MSANGAVSGKGTDAGIDLIPTGGQTLLGLPAGAAAATGAATVHYEYTGLEHKGTSFSGGHVWQFYDLSEDGKTVTLVDPRNTSVVTELPFVALCVTFKAGFYIGDAKVG